MNYRHAYHAGSFADVFKHIIEVTVISILAKKDKPFCYLDTHAGIGKYELTGSEAQKTKEYESGIAKIINKDKKKPAEIEQYLSIVRSMNERNKLSCYPGSPEIVRAMLRPEDKMILTELHPLDHKTLKDNFWNDPQVAVHLADGYQSLKAFLPPTPRRGMVLIDPPYENKTEFDILLKNLTMALKRWSTGIYLIWYPVKNRPQINFFHHQLERKIKCPFIITEFNLYPDDSPYLINGSGMIIVNPPWQLDKKIKEILSWLTQELDKEQLGNTKLIYNN